MKNNLLNLYLSKRYDKQDIKNIKIEPLDKVRDVNIKEMKDKGYFFKIKKTKLAVPKKYPPTIGSIIKLAFL